jgi:hypothetical protein
MARTTAQLKAMIAEHQTPAMLLSRGRRTVLVIAFSSVGLAVSSWIVERVVTPEAIAARAVVGCTAAGLAWLWYARRAREPVDRRVERELSYARPCGGCGALVLAFERACPQCGSEERLGTDPAINLWMPVLLIAALLVCVVALSALR